MTEKLLLRRRSTFCGSESGDMGAAAPLEMALLARTRGDAGDASALLCFIGAVLALGMFDFAIDAAVGLLYAPFARSLARDATRGPVAPSALPDKVAEAVIVSPMEGRTRLLNFALAGASLRMTCRVVEETVGRPGNPRPIEEVLTAGTASSDFRPIRGSISKAGRISDT